MSILTKPWTIAILALVLMLGTQLVALKLYWSTLFPERQAPAVHLVEREAPKSLIWGFSTSEIDSLRAELESRVAMLDLREGELSAYGARLMADKAEIEDIKVQVEGMRDELMNGIVELEEAEQKNLRTLAKTYATLTPDATVSIFRELDEPTVVKILFFMKTDTVGAILQEMATANGGNEEQIKRAASISNMLRLFSSNP